MAFTEYHGKTVEIAYPAGIVFNYLSDMRNFGHLMPSGVHNWQADQEQCSFEIRSIGQLKIRYEKKEMPTHLVCVSEIRGDDYRLEADIKPLSNDHCDVTFRFNGDMNMVTRMLVQKPVHTLLDALADLLGKQQL